MSTAPEPGTVLAGKYQVEKVLGVGGMGIVVSATHLQLDQRVAIKFLLPEALANAEVVQRFAREARAAAKIRGEHVARVIDVGQFDDGAPFMVMEYLEGHDLAKELENRGPLPVADAVRYLLEACEALAQAHVARIVHRDLKPSNLFLAEQPDKRSIVKVLDFGISKIDGAPTAALTRTSAMMGTAYYMSPEQLTRPKEVDARSDIWALGIIMYELLSGQPPFVGETVPEVIGAILQNQPTPLHHARPDVPVELSEVVSRCMQSSAAARFASVGAFAEALAPFGMDADRMSIAAITRVLGHTTASGAAGDTTVNERDRARGPAPSYPGIAATGPGTSDVGDRARLEASATALSAGALSPGTTALSTSMENLPPTKRSPLPFAIAGVAILIGLGGGAFALRGKGDAAGPTAAGLVAPSAPAPVEPIPSEAKPAAIAAEPATKPTTLSPIETAPAAAAVAVKHTEPAPAAKPAAKPTVKPHDPPKPTAKPRATPVAAPATTTPKNPLNMGIK